MANFKCQNLENQGAVKVRFTVLTSNYILKLACMPIENECSRDGLLDDFYKPDLVKTGTGLLRLSAIDS